MFSFLPRSLVGACSEIYKKVHPGEDKEEQEEEEDGKAGQDHIFTFYDGLEAEEQKQLDDDFDGIDADEVDEAWQSSQDVGNFALQGILAETPNLMNWDLKKPPMPTSGANVTRLQAVSDRKKVGWLNFGLELYSKDRIAIVLLSGGRDGRFGGDVPKGCLDIGLLSHKSIFQLYVERIRRLQHLVQRKFKRSVHIPLYIMCNRENKEIVEDFFKENEFFGIREQDVLFFKQGYYPVCDHRGKYLLTDKHRIALAPNGNGGMFKALVEEGMVSDMKSRGVSSLFVCSVDNLLAKVGDPVFMGFAETCKVDSAIKCVEKSLPDEKFGVFASLVYRDHLEDIDGDGRLDNVSKVKAAVIEFFELPDDVKKRRRQAGSGGMPLEMNCGNLSQYFFKVDFVKKVHALSLKKFHVIPQAMTVVDLKSGKKVNPLPGECNANRIEMFLFDAFEHCKAVPALVVPRTEYAVVKQRTGDNSPSSALQALGRLHQQWIILAGGSFVGSKVATETEDSKCEISPLVSYDGEDLMGHFPSAIPLPFYLPSHQEFTQFSAASVPQSRRPSTHYLERNSDIARRELEVELQAQLGTVLELMEDPSKYDYAGERAEENEALPPTPREAEQAGKKGKSSDSPRDDDSDAGSAGSKSPRRSPRSARAPRKDEEQEEVEEETPKGDEMQEEGLPNEIEGPSKDKAAQPKPSTRAKEDRKEYWSDAK